jgi:hypothetical protein
MANRPGVVGRHVSALSPNADIHAHDNNVCFMPKTYILKRRATVRTTNKKRFAQF